MVKSFDEASHRIDFALEFSDVSRPWRSYRPKRLTAWSNLALKRDGVSYAVQRQPNEILLRLVGFDRAI
jgi:hypothetical protein